MDSVSLLFTFVDFVALPGYCLCSLLATKLSIGDSLRRAEHRFLIALMIMSLVTLRTVTQLDDTWLVHSITLSGMILGVFLIPSREESALAY